MNVYRKIDVNGLFVEDVINSEVLEGEERFYISTPCPPGFYHPKWDGTKWVEGGTKPDKQPQEPSLEERLEQTEQLLQATTMAFTEFIFSQTMGKQHDDN